jgi:hypothetical protein
LLVLAVGTGVPMVLGSFVIRPIEDKKEGYQALAAAEEDDEDEVETDEAFARASSLELARSVSRGRDPSRGGPKPRDPSLTGLVNVLPSDVLRTFDFQLLFIILAITCGTGLMYINNVGAVALSLARDGKVEYDLKEVSAWQARQVAVISIWNCSGRILGGGSRGHSSFLLPSSLPLPSNVWPGPPPRSTEPDPRSHALH